MLVKKFAIQNVRSFLEREEFILDGPISIIIGPNGGGKTNLLDICTIMLRRYLFTSMYAVDRSINPQRYSLEPNDSLRGMHLERHSASEKELDQIVEVEIEVTAEDLKNMQEIELKWDHLAELASSKYINIPFSTTSWNLDEITVGSTFTYKLLNGNFQQQSGPAETFHQFLRMFETYQKLSKEFNSLPLTMPLVYFPVNRASNGFQSEIQLAGFNETDHKKQNDVTSSRAGTQIVHLAVGRLAQKYRLLLEEDNGNANLKFYEDPSLKELTKILKELGYEWSLETVDALKNHYDIKLKKQGTSFLIGAASSGEKELLTYLFPIYALNIRDAFIIVDEPELHLHPKWQKTLLKLFIRLAESTGNRFLLATHSPTFVSSESIQYVSRVFSKEQKSRIVRLSANELPNSKHLLSIINSQNNECLFFADKVLLVEGLSDRIFFEAILEHFGPPSSGSVLEVISVEGKTLFDAYKKILEAFKINFSILADLDYIEQVGTPEIKSLLKVNCTKIKKQVIDNPTSKDGDTLVQAIDNALQTGDWESAKDIWEYIKSRHRKLSSDMSEDEKNKLDEFITSKYTEELYILRMGSLEDYLPEGYQAKDMDKLIRFLNSGDFWENLPDSSKEELEAIAYRLLGTSVLRQSPSPELECSL